MKNMVIELQKGKNKGTLAEVLFETTNKKGIPVFKVVRLDNQRKGTWQVAKCALNEDESIQAIAKSITTPDIARIYQAGIEAYYKSNMMNWILNLDEVGQPIKADIAEINDIRKEIITACSSAKEIMDLHKTKQDSLMQIVHSNWKIEELEKAIGTLSNEEIVESVPPVTETQLEIEVEPVCGECGEPMDSEILHDKFDGFICQSCADDADKAADELADEHIEAIIAKTADNNLCSDSVASDTVVSPDELIENQAITAINNQMTPEDIEKVKISFAKCGYETIGIDYEDGARFGFILPGSKLKREPKQSLTDAITQFVDYDIIDCVTSKMFSDMDEAKFDLFKNISYYEDGDTEYNGNYVIVFDDIEWIEEVETTETTEEVQ